MSADFSDPHWAFIWPAYAVALITIVALAYAAWKRADFWAKQVEKAERQESNPSAAAPKP